MMTSAHANFSPSPKQSVVRHPGPTILIRGRHTTMCVPFALARISTCQFDVDSALPNFRSINGRRITGASTNIVMKRAAGIAKMNRYVAVVPGFTLPKPPRTGKVLPPGRCLCRHGDDGSGWPEQLQWGS